MRPVGRTKNELSSVNRPDIPLYHAIMDVIKPNTPLATWVLTLSLNFEAVSKVNVMNKPTNMLHNPIDERCDAIIITPVNMVHPKK